MNTIYFDVLGLDIEILFGGHESGRRKERNISKTEVLTFLELAKDEIVDLKMNKDFAIVSSCKTKAVIANFRNNRGNLCIDIITVLNNDISREVYIKDGTQIINL